MTLDLNTVMALVMRSIRNPREAAETILSLGVPREALWLVFMTVVVLSVFLSQLSNILIVTTGGSVIDGLLATPVQAGFIQFGLLLLMVMSVHFVGRAMGGQGSFEETLLLMSWLQFVMVTIQVVQIVALVVLPGLASLIGIFAVGLFLWLLTHFITVLHGFRSFGLVFAMILVSAFCIAFFISILLTMLGVAIPMGQI